MTIVISMICSSELLSADNYKKGDTLFVWAKNGLNVRNKPTTKSKVILKLLFCDSLKVIGIDFGEHNVLGISDHLKQEKDRTPVILNGNWIKIELIDGTVGYVVDQYLLKYKSNKKYKEREYEFPFDLIRCDTVFKREISSDGEGLNCKTINSYKHGIINTIEQGGVWYRSTYKFPDLTVEEVFIVMFLYDLDEYLTVLKYWPNLIEFHDDGLCRYKLYFKDGTATLEEFCSC